MGLRVAAYCRVSTDRADQANSLHSQQSYFRDYIEKNQDWHFAEIYADEGLSGTSTKRREAFNRMVGDAEAGKLDLILTKEVSRFARNTVDTLEFTRRLKKLGVGVIFTNDNLDTRENDGELRLTIMASIAQEESRKTSQRVKWGQKRRMEAGVVFGNDSTYGFTTTGGTLSIKEHEAAVIRLIYHKFLNEGKGTHIIARELYEEGLDPPKTAAGKWSCVMVRRILRNEKYAGDLLQKKFVTMDYLTHKKEENRGHEEQVYIRDHHQAIVDRTTWEATQAELIRRNGTQKDNTRYSNRYWCSGKIRCGTCGSRFVLRKTKRPNGNMYQSWGCHSRVQYGKWKRNGQGLSVGCNMRMLNDKSLISCVQFVLKQLDIDWGSIVNELMEDIRHVQDTALDGMRAEQLKTQCAGLERKKVRVMDAYFSETISKADMVQMTLKYDGQMEKLGIQLRQVEDAQRIRQEQHTGLDELARAMEECLYTSEQVYGEVIESIAVYETYITVQVRFLPIKFKLWYRTGGTGCAYSTTIEKFEIE